MVQAAADPQKWTARNRLSVLLPLSNESAGIGAQYVVTPSASPIDDIKRSVDYLVRKALVEALAWKLHSKKAHPLAELLQHYKESVDSTKGWLRQSIFGVGDIKAPIEEQEQSYISTLYMSVSNLIRDDRWGNPLDNLAFAWGKSVVCLRNLAKELCMLTSSTPRAIETQHVVTSLQPPTLQNCIPRSLAYYQHKPNTVLSLSAPPAMCDIIPPSPRDNGHSTAAPSLVLTSERAHNFIPASPRDNEKNLLAQFESELDAAIPGKLLVSLAQRTLKVISDKTGLATLTTHTVSNNRAVSNTYVHIPKSNGSTIGIETEKKRAKIILLVLTAMQYDHNAQVCILTRAAKSMDLMVRNKDSVCFTPAQSVACMMFVGVSGNAVLRFDRFVRTILRVHIFPAQLAIQMREKEEEFELEPETFKVPLRVKRITLIVLVYGGT